MKSKAEKQDKPFFSIIIPTYNRRAELAACLQAFAHLHYPRNRYEVLVVDDGSKTTPDSIVTSFQNGLDVRLLRQPRAGPAAARNKGASQARGRFLAFTDDDCLPAPDWLETLAARFEKDSDRLIGGRTFNILSVNSYSIASQAILDVVYAYYNTDPDDARFFATNNLAFSSDRFRELGGFDASFMTSEDREFCDRWLHNNHRMTYAPEVIVYHAHKLTLATFLRQHFHYGRGAFRFHQTRKKRGAGGFRPDPKLYSRLLSYPFSREYDGRALRLLSSLVLSQAASAAGYVREALKPRSREGR
jgi:glycosyltransferase involved in cell wall biosynthesis